VTPFLSRHLLGRWSVVWHVLISIVPVGGFLLIAGWVRQWLAPAAGPEVPTLIGGVMVALLVPAIVGMLMASSVRELLDCPFAWNLPSLPRQASRELRIVGSVLVAAMACLGPVLALGTRASPWFFPALAATGFALAILGNDPRGRSRVWPGGFATVIVCLLILFAPEVVDVSSTLPWLWAVGATALMLGVVSATETGAAQRHRASAGERRTGASIGSLDPFGLTSSALRDRRAPRGGAAKFRGVRHGDLDWSRAVLHEIAGSGIGGWMGSTVSFVAAGSLAAMLGLAVIGSVIPVRGAAPEPAGFEWLAEPLSRPRLMSISLLIAMFASMWSMANPLQPPLQVVRPLSRSRFAKVMWIVTQAQEVLAWLLALTALGAFLVVAKIGFSINAWPAARDALAALTATFLLIPFARWWRLQLIEARFTGVNARRFREVDRAVAGSAIVCTMIVASTLLLQLWRSARDLDALGRGVVIALSVALFFGLRGAWYFALRRFYLRHDL